MFTKYKCREDGQVALKFVPMVPLKLSIEANAFKSVALMEERTEVAISGN